MNPEIKALWITALRSGEYKQGRSSLNVDDKFCCLGVLCDLAEKAGVAKSIEGDDVTRYDGRSSYLPASVEGWAGMDSDRGTLAEEVEFSRPSAYGGEEMVTGKAWSLSLLNDVARYDFNQIADVIEAQF